MTNNLFYQANQSKDNAPVYEIELEENDINVIDLIFEAKFITSKSEARRLIASNGLSMDGKLITDISLRVTKEELKEGILFKKGKKAFLNIKLK